METSRIKLHNPDMKYELVLSRFKKSKKINPENKRLILEFLEYKKDSNPRITLSRLDRLLSTFITCESWFNKPFSEITKEDCKIVIKKLINNEFKRKISLGNIKANNDDYSETTKKDYIKNLKQLLRWIYYESKNKPQIDERGKELTYDQIFSNFVYQIDQDRIKEPTIITLDQAEVIAEKSSLTLGTIMMLSFDSGFRPEELWNIRIKDVKWEEEKKKYWIYCQFPKKGSKKRVVDVPLCTKWLNRYLTSNEDNRNGLFDAPLFRISYKYASLYFAKKCEGLFGYKIDMYTLRHSSIQYYLEIYNRDFIALADRYGWSYGSVGDRLKDYLARSKVRLPDASALVRKDKIDDMKKENESLKSKIELIEQKLQRESDERKRDLQDYAVKLLSDMKMINPNQVLVLKKQSYPIF